MKDPANGMIMSKVLVHTGSEAERYSMPDKRCHVTCGHAAAVKNCG